MKKQKNNQKKKIKESCLQKIIFELSFKYPGLSDKLVVPSCLSFKSKFESFEIRTVYTYELSVSMLNKEYGNIRNCHKKSTSEQLNIKINGVALKTILKTTNKDIFPYSFSSGVNKPFSWRMPQQFFE